MTTMNSKFLEELLTKGYVEQTRPTEEDYLLMRMTEHAIEKSRDKQKKGSDAPNND